MYQNRGALSTSGFLGTRTKHRVVLMPYYDKVLSIIQLHHVPIVNCYTDIFQLYSIQHKNDLKLLPKSQWLNKIVVETKWVRLCFYACIYCTIVNYMIVCLLLFCFFSFFFLFSLLYHSKDSSEITFMLIFHYHSPLIDYNIVIRDVFSF